MPLPPLSSSLPAQIGYLNPLSFLSVYVQWYVAVSVAQDDNDDDDGDDDDDDDDDNLMHSTSLQSVVRFIPPLACTSPSNVRAQAAGRKIDVSVSPSEDGNDSTLAGRVRGKKKCLCAPPIPLLHKEEMLLAGEKKDFSSSLRRACATPKRGRWQAQSAWFLFPRGRAL